MQPAKDNWIKVEDQTPKGSQELWLWDGKEAQHWNVHLSWIKSKSEFLKLCAKHGITHWMIFYRPNPPKK